MSDGARLGERIIRAAAAEVGVLEAPLGSNRGPRVGEYQRSTYLGGTGWPWCGAFVCFVWQAAGVERELARRIASPSVARMCQVAAEDGLVCSPRPGAAVAWCGVHVEVLYAPLGGNVWRTVGGNTDDGVRWRTRSVLGATVFGPPGLEDDGPAIGGQTLYWLEDVGAHELVLPGRWDRQSYAQRARERLDPAERHRVRVRRSGDWWYLVRGQPRHYGPWIGAAGKVARDGDGPAGHGARAMLEARLGRRLRPYRTERMPAPPHETLGKVD